MSKRANGEGSIYQRKDGRWTAATYVLNAAGGRQRRQVYGRTRAEVSRKLTELNAKTAQGVPSAATSWTVESFARHWLEEVVPGSLRPATVANYSWMLRKYIVPTLGKVKLEQLGPSHVRRLHAAVESGGVSAHTSQLAHSVLRSLLAEAMREQIVARNVATLVRAPRPDKQEVQPWTPEEAQTFLASAEGDQFSGLFVLALGLGLRRGELLGLRWQDVDFAGSRLHVRQTAQRLDAQQGLVMGPPKTSRSRRTIPLPDFCRDALRRRRAEQLVERAAVDSWPDSDLVFATRLGTVIEPSNLRRSFNRAIERAKVRRIRFHDLRHTCASLLLAQGVPLRVVMDVLGHSTMSITTDLYAHVMPSALVGAADAMQSALGTSAESDSERKETK